MALGAQPRSRTLATQAQGNLSSTLAAHRNRLTNAAAAVPPRPPQLPEVTGYPSRSTTPGGSLVLPPVTPPQSASLELSRTPQKSPTGFQTGDSLFAEPQSSPLASRSSRSISLGAPKVKTPKRSPPGSADSDAPSGGSRGTSKRSTSVNKVLKEEDPLSFAAAVAEAEAAFAAEAQTDGDAVFDRQLRELEELSALLGLSQDDRSLEVESSSQYSVDVFRPATGTSASASTTAPPGSEVAHGELEEPDLSAPLGDAFDTLQGAQRAHYELQMFPLPHGCRLEQATGLSGQFFFSIDVTDGPYTPSTVTFWVKVFDEFPEPGSVSVRCTTRIFHPSIDPDSCRLELREPLSTGQSGNSFKALLLEIRNVIFSPSDAPAANADAAMLLQTDPDEFRRIVRSTLLGGEYRGYKFDRLMAAGTQRGSGESDAGNSSRLSKEMKLKLMNVESLKEQLKAKVSAFQAANTLEINSL